MAIDASSHASVASPDDTSREPVAIEVRDLEKSFRLPGQKIDSLKERVLHPTVSRDYSELQALDGVSFDVRRGEFFGIVGRNGSGKSTLLKILASIYRADRGSVRMAGRLAPFIELGVGFNMELTARENVQLNGVMMGLTRKQAAGRLDSVLEFAELEDFVDLKLKNYSSGMLVRLGFSVMIQADADILLVDEVLAVGDAAFQQKCADVFQEMKRGEKTIVLVTHDMSAVDSYCDRAILLHGGKVVQEGDPHEVGRRYLRLNFESSASGAGAELTAGPEVRVLDVWLEDAAGERTSSLEVGAEIHLRAEVEALAEIPRPAFAFLLTNADGLQIFGGSSRLREVEDPVDDRIPAGRRATLSARIHNRLGPGHYFFDLGLNREHNAADNVVWVSKAVDFVVYGTGGQAGLIDLECVVKATVDPL